MKIAMMAALALTLGVLVLHDADEKHHARDAAAARAGVAHQLELQHAEIVELRESVEALGVACEARR